jgi:hypothetical protein
MQLIFALSGDSMAASKSPNNRPSAPSSATSVSRGWLFWLGRSLLLLLVLLILSIPLIRFAGPPLALSWLQQWYADQGEDYQLTLTDWQLAVISGELTLTGVTLQHPGVGAGATRIRQLTLDIDTGQIQHQLIDITRLRLDGVRLAAVRQGDQLLVAGLSLPLAANGAETATENSQTTAASTPWAVRLGNLSLTDWLLGWQQDGLDTQLSMPSVDISGFDSRTDDDIELAATLSLDRLSGNQQLLQSLAPDLDLNTLIPGLPAGTPQTLTLDQPMLLKWQGRLTHWHTDPGVSGDLAIGPLALTLLDTTQAGFGSLKLQGLVADAEQQNLSQFQLDGVSIKSRVDASVTPTAEPVTLFALNRYQANTLAFDGITLSVGQQTIVGVSLDGRYYDGNIAGLPLQLPTSAAAADETAAPASADSHATTTNTSSSANAVSRQFEVLLQGIVVNDVDLRWQQAGIQARITANEMTVGLVNSAENLPIDLQGSLQVAELHISQPQPVDLKQPLIFSWQGALNDWRRDPELTGDVTFKHFDAVVGNQPPVSLEELNLNGIRADRSVQTLEQLVVNGLTLQLPDSANAIARKQGILFSLGRYEVPSIVFDGQTLSTGIHQFSGLQAHLTRLENGLIAGLPSPSTVTVAANTSSINTGSTGNNKGVMDESASDEAGLVVHIAGVTMMEASAEEPSASSIYWYDLAVSPPHKSTLTLKAVSIGELDSAALLNETGKPVPVSVSAGLDDYNSIEFTANAGLRQGLPEGKFKLVVRQLNLPPFSPYVVEAMGYKVQKGMLKLDSNLDIVNGQMKGKALLVLQNSRFEPEDQDTIDRVSKQISMPLETALSVLKDDNNNLRIDVPLTGAVNDPDIGIQDVLQQVTKKAVRTATLFYLKQAFQPYGTLISIASLASDQLFAIRLNPLTFAEQDSTLSPEHQSYLDKVATTMASKTELELQVCPLVSRGEANTLGEGWQALAIARGQSVKAYLAQRQDEKKHSLGDRVSVCNPAIAETPQVALGF